MFREAYIVIILGMVACSKEPTRSEPNGSKASARDHPANSGEKSDPPFSESSFLKDALWHHLVNRPAELSKGDESFKEGKMFFVFDDFDRAVLSDALPKFSTLTRYNFMTKSEFEEFATNTALDETKFICSFVNRGTPTIEGYPTLRISSRTVYKKDGKLKSGSSGHDWAYAYLRINGGYSPWLYGEMISD